MEISPIAMVVVQATVIIPIVGFVIQTRVIIATISHPAARDSSQNSLVAEFAAN